MNDLNDGIFPSMGGSGSPLSGTKWLSMDDVEQFIKSKREEDLDWEEIENLLTKEGMDEHFAKSILEGAKKEEEEAKIPTYHLKNWWLWLLIGTFMVGLGIFFGHEYPWRAKILIFAGIFTILGSMKRYPQKPKT